MVAARRRSDSTESGRTLALTFLLSFFGALLASMLALKARRSGKSGVGWVVLSVLFIAVFGVTAYAITTHSDPQQEPVWFWLGTSAMVTNGIALLILIKALRA